MSNEQTLPPIRCVKCGYEITDGQYFYEYGSEQVGQPEPTCLKCHVEPSGLSNLTCPYCHKTFAVYPMGNNDEAVPES